MSKIPFALHNAQPLEIEPALALKAALGKRFRAGTLTCPECGEPVKPHSSGGNSPAHFEHYRRNRNCSISHVRSNRSSDRKTKRSKQEQITDERKHAFEDYLKSNSAEGSGKPTSYVRGLELLEAMIATHPLGFDECMDIWSINSLDMLSKLSERLTTEKKKGKSSVWNIDGIPQSYLRDGFCSAALNAYQQFLALYEFESAIEAKLDAYRGNPSDLESLAREEPTVPKKLLEEWKQHSGREVLREIKMRANQNVFRKVILSEYASTCCITGNPIANLLTASHIKPWKDSDDSEKLNPANGLCLAKTQDAAFDKGLITLDESFRVVLSKRIRDHMTTQSIKDNFIRYEGNPITLPSRFKPDQSFLAYHRDKIFAN